MSDPITAALVGAGIGAVGGATTGNNPFKTALLGAGLGAGGAGLLGAGGATAGGATGGGTDDVFYENGQTVTTNYTLTTNKNAMSAGPIVIDSGVTVTVPSGSVWVIV